MDTPIQPPIPARTKHPHAAKKQGYAPHIPAHSFRRFQFLSTSATACAAMPEPSPVNPRWLLRRRLHADLLRVDPERAGDIAPHLRAVGRDLRRLRDERRVDVHHLHTALRELLRHPLKQQDARHVQQRRVAVWKERPDIRKPRRAEQRVHHRVHEHIRVGMPVEPAVIVDMYAAENQRPPRHEPVYVVAVSDAQVCHAFRSSLCRRIAAATARSSGRVILIFSGLPGRR